VTVTTVLFDLDGVLRHFDPATTGRVEALHGLEPGRLERTAFSPELLRAVTVGELSNEQWVARIGELVGSHVAASAWRNQHATVDADVLAVARELRDAGVHVSLFSNATDGLCEELAGSPLMEVVEWVFNSADLGRAKPDRAAYEAVLQALGADPAAVLFVDDRLVNVEGARSAGMLGHLHQGRGRHAAAALRRALDDAGLLRRC
jgi:HAD superfamily hydrolase (TIGR01509 family)